MTRLAARQQIGFALCMAQPKSSTDGKAQHRRFIEAAREHVTDDSEDACRKALRTVATAPVEKPKKGSRPPKR